MGCNLQSSGYMGTSSHMNYAWSTVLIIHLHLGPNIKKNLRLYLHNSAKVHMGCNDSSLLLYLPLHMHVCVNEHHELKAFFFFCMDPCNSIQKSRHNFNYPVKGFTWFCQFFQGNVLKQTITNSFPALARTYACLFYVTLISGIGKRSLNNLHFVQ